MNWTAETIVKEFLTHVDWCKRMREPFPYQNLERFLEPHNFTEETKQAVRDAIDSSWVPRHRVMPRKVSDEEDRERAVVCCVNQYRKFRQFRARSNELDLIFKNNPGVYFHGTFEDLSVYHQICRMCGHHTS